MRPLVFPLVLALLPAVPAAAGKPAAKPRVAVGLVRNAQDAKRIAEVETGGIAVDARRTRLNGASCGWEVDVHMPKEDRGWRCMVDCDTRQVHTKDRIPNPPVRKRKGSGRT